MRRRAERCTGRSRLTRWAVTSWAAALSLAVLLAAEPVAGQQVVAELKAGAAVGNYTETSAGLDLLPEPAIGFLVEVWPTRTLAGYAGLTRNSFGCEEGFCTDRNATFTSQGLVLGGRWSPGLPWVRAGLAVLSLSSQAEGATESPGGGLGFEVAGGLEFEVGPALLRPGVTYLRHNASNGHAALLALEIGVAMGVAQF